MFAANSALFPRADRGRHGEAGSRHPRVVVIGAGFGGLAAVRVLRRKPLEITWIDRRNHHLFQPLLYQVATAALSPADIAAPVREIARHAQNVQVVMGEVVAIDVAERTVSTRQQRVPYEYLIIASGAETSYFGNATWARCTEGLKDLDEAVAIRRKLLLALERAEMAGSEEERARLLSFVLIGAGPTGVELAGAIADLAKNILAGDYRNIQPATISVTLLEAMDQILPGYPPDLAAYARRKLVGMGVQVRTGCLVEQIDEQGVMVAGERIPGAMTIWCAGVKASPLTASLDAEADKKGRIKVEPDLTVPNDPRVFVIGDAALARDRNGDPLPGLAAVAKQQGTFAGRRILDRIRGKASGAPFRYRDWGILATIGRASAVADLRVLHLRGFPAWFVWVVVHIWYLVAFRNRVRVLLNWAFQYLSYSPGARLITGNPAENERAAPRVDKIDKKGPMA